ncbi:MAG: MATE family efflux transporter [Deltaproteobacteria bacterium]|nr:MATE family efflux transporter [Deltaproteobacteria bacterium]
MPENIRLTIDPVPGLIRKIAVPASIGFFFNTMFNVVDTYFAGWISTQALAALSLSIPVFFIIIAMGSGISTGTTALIANALGSRKREKAQTIAIQGISGGVLVGLGVTALGMYVTPRIFCLLGASGLYLHISIVYMDIIFAGTVFFMLNYMFNAILNALGDTRSFRNFLIIGFVLNIVLDPWFIYGGLGIPPLRVVGIALSTVLIQLVGCGYLGYRVYRTRLIRFGSVLDVLPRIGPLKEIAGQGLPASFHYLTIGLGFFVITYFISKFGKEAVAAYGIAIRIEQIVLLPTIGLNIATLTIVAQNNGASLFGRVRQTVNKALYYGTLCWGIGIIWVILFAPYLMDLFTDNPEVIAIGTTYLRIAAWVFYAYVIIFIHIAALQGVKRPMFGVYIGLLRQIVAPVIVFYVLSQVLGYGLLGIWWGIFAITWIAALVTVAYTRHVLKQNEFQAVSAA